VAHDKKQSNMHEQSTNGHSLSSSQLNLQRAASQRAYETKDNESWRFPWRANENPAAGSGSQWDRVGIYMCHVIGVLWETLGSCVHVTFRRTS